MRVDCDCSEGFIRREDGTIYRLPPVHDCLYIRERNALIPEAMAIAEADTADGGRSLRFARAMDRLAKQRISRVRQGTV